MNSQGSICCRSGRELLAAVWFAVLTAREVVVQHEKANGKQHSKKLSLEEGTPA